MAWPVPSVPTRIQCIACVPSLQVCRALQACSMVRTHHSQQHQLLNARVHENKKANRQLLDLLHATGCGCWDSGSVSAQAAAAVLSHILR
jgi:hypothetical protein